MYPEKEVTIISSGTEFVAGPFTPKFKTKLEQKIKQMGILIIYYLTLGIKVIFNTRVENLPSDPHDLLKPITLSTSAGNIEADMVFKCYGVQFNNSLGKFLNVLDDKGTIKVNEFLQVEGHENIFCVGNLS